MKRWLLPLLCVFVAPAFAQRAEPKFHVDSKEIATVSEQLKLAKGAVAGTLRVALSPPTAAERRSLDDANAAPGHKALQIGFGRSAALDVSALQWTALADGGHAARFSVTSPAAAALRLGFAIARMEPGVELRFFGSADPARVYGPITARQIRAAEPLWWSPVIEGETLTAEIYLARGLAPGAFAFELPAVSHLVATVTTAMHLKAGESGSCNVDVACAVNPTPGFVAATKSVARMVYNAGSKSYLCTGTLVADTSAATSNPYFFTAAHCISDALSASSLNTYWFYEAATCGGGFSPNTVQRFGGATLLVADPALDTTLLVLSDTPPTGAVFAAWDATQIPVKTAVTGIHHPQGDLKKKSLGSMTKYSKNPDPWPYAVNSFANVQWSSGVTEGGSSGSGLFVPDGDTWYLRGGLYGGHATCAKPTAADYYSRLDLFYPAVKQYLDPGVVPVQVIEFYNAALDHYFITWVGAEIEALDHGDTVGWQRTGFTFSVFPAERSGTSAVCRIYIPPGKGDGHFFGRDKAECDGTMARNPTFVLESPGFFYLYPASAGTCASGQTPVYRLYSNRPDANHRYVTNRIERNTMVAKGWLAEGDGPDVVVMCAP